MSAENALVPDAAFILENRESGNEPLFFLEMDMATERIVSTNLRETRLSLHYKFEQYDRYLNSMRYAQKYKDFGDFGYFTLLFVTFGEERVQNIRAQKCRIYLLSLPTTAVSPHLIKQWAIFS